MLTCCGSRDSKDLNYLKYESNNPTVSVIPLPELPDQDSVLIEIHFATITPNDQKMIRFGSCIGRTFSGTVKKAGENAKDLTKKEVYGWIINDFGAVSNFVIVKKEAVAVKPKEITPEIAAALPILGAFARQCFESIEDKSKVYWVGNDKCLETIFATIAKAKSAEVVPTGAENISWVCHTSHNLPAKISNVKIPKGITWDPNVKLDGFTHYPNDFTDFAANVKFIDGHLDLFKGLKPCESVSGSNGDIRKHLTDINQGKAVDIITIEVKPVLNKLEASTKPDNKGAKPNKDTQGTTQQSSTNSTNVQTTTVTQK